MNEPTKRDLWWVANPNGHVWQKFEDTDEPDRMATTNGEYHNGPRCIVCGYSFCEHCVSEVPPCPGAASAQSTEPQEADAEAKVLDSIASTLDGLGSHEFCNKLRAIAVRLREENRDGLLTKNKNLESENAALRARLAPKPSRSEAPELDDLIVSEARQLADELETASWFALGGNILAPSQQEQYNNGRAKELAEWLPIIKRYLAARPSREEEMREAQVFRAVTNAIYFDDSSDYLGALYEVVAILKPGFEPERMPFYETDEEARAAIAQGGAQEQGEGKR